MQTCLLPKALLLLALPTLGLLPAPVRAQQAPAPDLKAAFQNPPEAAKPWVFWYWMNGAVTPAGITADLEAMKEAGIGGAYLMPIKDVENPPAISPPARQLSPQWWAMVKHSMQEADRLGLKLAMHVSDGFALAGGPWITPELSMQHVVSAQTQVAGGKKLSLLLPQPPKVQGYYRDIAVYAYPTPVGSGASTASIRPQITSSLTGENLDLLATQSNKKGFKTSESGWIQYAFDQPFTCMECFIGTALLKYIASQRLLSIYAVIAMALCAVAVFGDGAYVIYALGGLGFFMSIMFPTIFALGIAGLGDDTKPGSSWLVMSIVGGAIMPPLMGSLIDLRGDNIQIGYLIPLVCYLVVLLFGLYGYRVKGRLV